LDGHSLERFASDAQADSLHSELFWRQGGRAALRSGEYKIVAPGRSAKNRRWELYNIEQDLAETNDLATQRPEILEDLIQRFQVLDQEMSAPLF
jgi:arylsulfatase A-like enzyme